MEALTPRKKYLQRLHALKSERASWDSHWRELAEYVQPRRSKFFVSERNRGDKKNQHLVNSTSTWSARTLAAGMMAGITSPARPWFRLTVPDPDLAESGAVRDWLHIVEERMRQAFARSNIYNGLHQVYSDLGTIGTACLYVEEDVEDVLRAYTFPVGQYSLANSSRLAVEAVYRECSMTVGQLVQEFGLENCSDRVKDLHERGNVDEWIEILHVIEPHKQAQHGMVGPEGMAFHSCWMEAARDENEAFLRRSGYEEFPIMAPRWTIHGEDVYGSSPGMEALGDARALQLLEQWKAQVIAKIVTPPMRGPASLRNQRVSLLPGDITYVPENSAAQVFAPAVEINPQAIPAVAAEIREHEQRIKQAFFADLWLMLSRSDTGQMTAREVAERHEEKMLQLGPVMERLQDELLDPLIDRAFGILTRSGMIPRPPQELEGMEMRVEYISIMAQAQKLLGTSSIERLASFAGNLAAVKPEVLDKINWDEMVDEYGGALGVKPDLINTDEEVEAIRSRRTQQMQQAQQLEQAGALAQGAKTLSETDLKGDSALNRLLGSLGGVAPGGTQ